MDYHRSDDGPTDGLRTFGKRGAHGVEGGDDGRRIGGITLQIVPGERRLTLLATQLNLHVQQLGEDFTSRVGFQIGHIIGNIGLFAPLPVFDKSFAKSADDE